MKKKTLLVASALILSTTLLTGCAIDFGITSRNNKKSGIASFIKKLTNVDINFNNNSSSSSDSSTIYKEDFNKTLPMEGIKDIDISVLASEVTIKAIPGSDITLNCIGSSNIVTGTSFEKSGSTIIIKENGKNSDSFNLNDFNVNSREVVIGIPESFEGNALISCGAGSLIINDVNFNSLDLDGGMGDIDISNISFNRLILDQGMGEINITLNKKCGDMDISGGMGEFYLSLEEVGGNLTYSGGIGEATIDLPNNAPVKIITDTGLGETNISATTSEKTTYTFDLSVGIGSLTVK